MEMGLIFLLLVISQFKVLTVLPSYPGMHVAEHLPWWSRGRAGGFVTVPPPVWGQVGPCEDREDGERPLGPSAAHPLSAWPLLLVQTSLKGPNLGYHFPVDTRAQRCPGHLLKR